MFFFLLFFFNSLKWCGKHFKRIFLFSKTVYVFFSGISLLCILWWGNFACKYQIELSVLKHTSFLAMQTLFLRLEPVIRIANKKKKQRCKMFFRISFFLSVFVNLQPKYIKKRKQKTTVVDKYTSKLWIFFCKHFETSRCACMNVLSPLRSIGDQTK